MFKPQCFTPKKTLLKAAFFIAVSVLLSQAAGGQEKSATEQKYRMPHKEIAALVDAPVTPAFSLSPDRQWGLLLHFPTLAPISELAKPELRLAGLRIDPRSNGPSRGRYLNKLTLINMADGTERPVTGLPDEPKVGNISWSPDGKLLAFSITTDNTVQLWIAKVADGKAAQIQGIRLNATFRGSPFHWLPDSRRLICKVVNPDRGEVPKASEVPEGPVIKESIGKAAPARTYQDLLKNSYHEALFEYYTSARLMLVNVEGENSFLGDSAGIFADAEPSPDGKYILVETIHRPFSYLVPYYRFPNLVEIWDLEGKVVKQIADLPLAEEIPVAFDAVATGPRFFNWRQDAPATLCWTEAADGGDPKVKADVRDRVYTLPAPFEGEPVLLAELGLRFASAFWSEDGFALVNSRWWRNRRTKTWLVHPDDPTKKQHILIDRSYEDRYNDPGNPVFRPTEKGTYVLKTADSGKTLFLIGRGASPEGDRPFVDRFDLATGKSTRLWRSEAPNYEYPYEVLDEQGKLILTRRESVSKPPNYYIRNPETGDIKSLTNFPHPMPQLAKVSKELITYKREDGVDLSATLYLPPGYTPEQGPIPLIMWAYPREFKSADAAGQVQGSPYSFVRISTTSPLLFLIRGYAVLYGPTMPIIGEGDKEPNDTYVQQLVASAKAAVDEMVRRGISDGKRIAIGGHSYGAFMVANLLAHSDLYAAGIARSGAYNRSLTPFGFQAEERTFWQAPEIYFAMSPFMHAHKVNEPILLIHGAADNNSGTFPVQSERFYHALKGHGATVRLVMLPNESHGYRARESVMHMLWETSEWLDRYVRDADK